MPEGNTNRDKIEIALRNAIQETFGSDEHIDLVLTRDPNGHLQITIHGLTLDDNGDIVPSEIEYHFDANVLIGFSGTIKARNDDHAEELFSEWIENIEIIDTSYSDEIETTVQYIARHDLYNLDN